MVIHHRSGGGDGRPLLIAVTGPQRRITDHFHDEYWKETDQHRFEDRIASEVNGVKREVRSLNNRITLLMGAIGLLAFLLPLLAPFIRSLVGFP